MIHHNKYLFIPFLLLIIWNCDDQYNKGNEIISITSSDSTVRGGFTVELACEATDQDGDKLTYFWESASGSLDQNGDSAAWTAPLNSGFYYITCTVADGEGASAVGSIAIRVFPRNTGIDIISITSSDSTVRGGLTVELACEAIDWDGDELSYLWESASGSLDQNGDSTAAWTAPLDSGFYYITCTAADDYGASAVDSIAIRALPSPVPVSGLEWTLTDDGLLNGPNSSNENNTGITDYWDGTVENADFGWNVTIQEETDSSITQSLQFKVEDSANCGGDNGNTQNGTATANIQVNGSSALTLELDFSGIGEAQSAGYDRIIFKLNGNVIGDGQAPGGGLGCAADSVLVNNAGPQILDPGPHTLIIEFTTGDAAYHVDAYYEIKAKLIAP